MAEDQQVFLVRHGEGYHNASQNWDLQDPKLTAIGQGQASALGACKELALSPGSLLVVSPLSRAIATAVAAFPHIATQDPGCRVALCALHSERVGAHCDQGRSKSALLSDYPFISHWDGSTDLPEEWTLTTASDKDWEKERVPLFLAWLRQQSERHIVVIGHGAYFASKDLAGRHLQNCEFVELP